MTFTPHLRPTTHSSTPWAKGDDKACFETDRVGQTTLRFEWWRDALWLIDSNDHVVLCDRRGLSRLGIHGFDVRGLSHYRATARRDDFTPGHSVHLHRDPQNPYDKNAIQVRAIGSHEPVGYVNKQKAATLAKMLDRGDNLNAICLRGAPPGAQPAKISILVATPELITHLLRNLATDANSVRLTK